MSLTESVTFFRWLAHLRVFQSYLRWISLACFRPKWLLQRMIDLFYAIPGLLKRDVNNIFVFFCKFNYHHFFIIRSRFQQHCCSFLYFSSSSLLYVQVKAAFQRFDRNGDDRLNYREFCHMIHMRWQKIWWIFKV